MSSSKPMNGRALQTTSHNRQPNASSTCCFRCRATGRPASRWGRCEAMQMQIDEAYLLAQLKALLAIDSPTGYTDEVVHHCSRELERLGLKPELTRRGAIRAVRRGGVREGARAIVAHLDTLGAQVKLVKENGRLEL